jgi:hypothetical protein
MSSGSGSRRRRAAVASGLSAVSLARERMATVIGSAKIMAPLSEQWLHLYSATVMALRYSTFSVA